MSVKKRQPIPVNRAMKRKIKHVDKPVEDAPPPPLPTKEEIAAKLKDKKCLVLVSGGEHSAFAVQFCKSLGFAKVQALHVHTLGDEYVDEGKCLDIAKMYDVKMSFVNIATRAKVSSPTYMSQLMTLAWDWAIENGLDTLCLGVTKPDDHVAASQLSEFIATMNYALYLNTKGQGGDNLTFYTPFIRKNADDYLAFVSDFMSQDAGEVHA